MTDVPLGVTEISLLSRDRLLTEFAASLGNGRRPRLPLMGGAARTVTMVRSPFSWGLAQPYVSFELS
ncbi:hypothetical protein [Streptomyces sp. NPDC007205]|uniref:hypothetical protein n=1 Tax=Streptomyces sp. NPDC007205 TaxID=3154316 RepID=UPI0033FCC4D2